MQTSRSQSSASCDSYSWLDSEGLDSSPRSSLADSANDFLGSGCDHFQDGPTLVRTKSERRVMAKSSEVAQPEVRTVDWALSVDAIDEVMKLIASLDDDEDGSTSFGFDETFSN